MMRTNLKIYCASTEKYAVYPPQDICANQNICCVLTKAKDIPRTYQRIGCVLTKGYAAY